MLTNRRRSKARRRDTIRPGERFQGEVRDLNSDGQGVVTHPTGRVLFVPGVWTGECGQFEIVGIKGRMGFARLVALDTPSASRVAPPCPHHGVTAADCGGCPWQYIAYEEQLRIKQQRVCRALEDLVGEDMIKPIWGSPEIFGYRNRAQFKSDGKRLGYVAGGSRELVDIQDCVILNSHNRNTLQALRGELPRQDWQPARGKSWTTLDIDDAISAEQIQVNTRRPFRQGNSAQNTRMQQWLAEQLDKLEPGSPALELFAGSGNFTEVLVDSGCASILAVDSFEPAVMQLASRNLPGVITRRADLSRPDAAANLGAEPASARLLLLDPPRDGFKHLGPLLEAAPLLSHIMYISCDLATLARDLAEAVARGFRLQSVQPLDLFPHTPHVEMLTLLTRES